MIHKGHRQSQVGMRLLLIEVLRKKESEMEICVQEVWYLREVKEAG